VFGTKKLPNIGKDLGSAVRGFKEGMKSESERPDLADKPTEEKTGRVIDGDSEKK